jgi:hypothetical protein
MKPLDTSLLKGGLQRRSQKIRYDKFVSKFLECNSAIDAYLFISPNVLRKSAIEQSSLLFKHPYIKSEIKRRNDKMSEKMDKKRVMNTEKLLQELELILSKCKGEGEHALSLKSLDQIAKVIGSYAPIKTDNKHEGVTINYILPQDEDDIEDDIEK